SEGTAAATGAATQASTVGPLQFKATGKGAATATAAADETAFGIGASRYFVRFQTDTFYFYDYTASVDAQAAGPQGYGKTFSYLYDDHRQKLCLDDVRFSPG
ncbi:MAG: hypothetical protein ABJC51_03960, partial [Acidobacteriota bacterium]